MLKKEKLRLYGVICFLALFIIMSMTSCKKEQVDQSNTIKIAYLPITHALPLFEEYENWKSEDSEYKIELVKYGSWPELMDALNTGRIDGAVVLIELAMKAKVQGSDLQAVALGHKDGNVIIVGKEIQSVEELKGKSFAIPHRQSSHHLLLQEMLEKNNLSIEDITVVEMAPSEMPAALSSGQIAGYCVAEPFGAKAVSLGVGRVLYESRDLWEDSACCSLVLGGNFIQQKKTLAKQFVKDYAKAGENLNEEEAIRIGKEYLNQDEDVLKTSLQWISYQDLAITKEEYEELTKRILKYQLMEKCPTYEEFVNATLLEE